MKRKRRITLLGMVLVASLASTSCEALFAGMNAEMLVPSVQLSEETAMLVDPPDLMALAKYFCPQILSFPADQACVLLGPPPRKEELQFRFQLVFEIDNPNQIPVPTTEILVGLHVYPGETFGELGAICTTLCEQGADDCPIPPDGACVDLESDIDTVEEFFAAAVQGGLVLATEALNGDPVGQHLGLYTVPAGETLELKVTFAIGIDPLLRVLGYTANDYLDQIIQNQSTSLDIPYAVAGRVWFNVPYLGRVAVGFGPFGEPDPLIWNVF